jgi:hypothetical protein
MAARAFSKAGATVFSSSGVNDDVNRMFNGMSLGQPDSKLHSCNYHRTSTAFPRVQPIEGTGWSPDAEKSLGTGG